MTYTDYELSDEHALALVPKLRKPWFEAWLKERDKRTASSAAGLLRRWEVADGNIGRFDRGLHLLGHLARGGTLEEYGEPE